MPQEIGVGNAGVFSPPLRRNSRQGSRPREISMLTSIFLSSSRSILKFGCVLLSALALVAVSLEAQAQSVKSVTLEPVAVTGGCSSTGTITLTSPAPAGGLTVAVASSDVSVATAPADVVVDAGHRARTFSVTTSPVSVAAVATITANVGAVGKCAAITVNPAILKSVTIKPDSVEGGSESATGTVRLSGPAPAAGVAVDLSSSNTGAATVESSVVVRAGANAATFTIGTLAVGSRATAIISAVLGGVTVSATMTVTAGKLPEVFGQGVFQSLNNGWGAVPHGIAVDPATQDMYVAAWDDAYYGAVVKFDRYGNYLQTFGTTGAGTLKSANGIAVDSDGNVYVGDYHGLDCVEFDRDGGYIKTFSGASSGVNLVAPMGVAVDNQHNVFVADMGGNRIVVFSKEGAVAYQFTTIIGTITNSSGTVGIALDGENHVWVADYWTHVFAEYSVKGTLKAFYGNYGEGPEPGFFYDPYGIAVSGKDVYVTDVGIGDIQEFDNKGNFIALQDEYGPAPEQWINPYGVAVNARGDVLVSDGNNNQMVVYYPPF
jgi:sugar lactone lactonase YvrE